MLLKVLIVEDNKAHMDALCKILKCLNRDLQVYCAYDMAEAFNLVLEQHINLFLVDIILKTDKPGDVSGLNFVREIRGISKYRFTPVIFITSLEDPRLYAYSQLHCFGYIEKPFAVEQVKNIVRDALEFPMREEEEKYVYFRKEGIVYSKCIKEIVHIENGKRRLVIHCINDELVIPHKTCEEILKELDSELFVQCSRYDIINRKHIEQIDYTNRFVKMKYKEAPVEIGAIMKKSFKQRMEDGYLH